MMRLRHPSPCDGRSPFAGTRALIALVVATTTAGAISPAIAETRTPYASPVTPAAYVDSYCDGTLTPISLANNKPGAPIDVGYGAETIAITPDGTTAWVWWAGGNEIAPFNLSTGAEGSPINVGASAPSWQGIAISPDGTHAYLTKEAANAVEAVDLDTGSEAIIHVSGQPDAIAVNPNGRTAYVASFTADKLTPINLSTDKAGTPIGVASGPAGIAITPNGRMAYVTDESADSVTPVNLATGLASTPIPVGTGPVGIAINPSGTRAYVTDHGGRTVTPIDFSSGTTLTPITLAADSAPEGIAISPDSTTAYVAEQGTGGSSCDSLTDRTVVPIHLATDTVEKQVTVGQGPTAIAITPGWTKQATQPDAGTNLGPALANVGGTLYAVWRGSGVSQDIWYSSYNGTTWSAQATVTGSWGTATSVFAPAVASYNGHLYVAWTDSANQIDVTSLSGGSWASPSTVSGAWGTALTNKQPALAPLSGDLYAAWKGNASGNSHIWFSHYDDSSWSKQTRLSITSPDAPAIAGDTYDGSLVYVWTTTTNNVDYLFCCGGSPTTLPQAITNQSPSIAAMGDFLYVAWRGHGKSTKIYYEGCFPNFCWTAQETQPQAGTSYTPAMAAVGQTLYMGWTGTAPSTKIFYASANDPY